MPKSTTIPKILTTLESLARQLEDVSPAALATWLQPIFIHLAPAVRGAEIPQRVAELSRLVGVELGQPEEA